MRATGISDDPVAVSLSLINPDGPLPFFEARVFTKGLVNPVRERAINTRTETKA